MFWCGLWIRIRRPMPLLMNPDLDPDADPDPATFAIDLQDVDKNLTVFLKVHLHQV
jgi:hypothetical protein